MCLFFCKCIGWHRIHIKKNIFMFQDFTFKNMNWQEIFHSFKDGKVILRSEKIIPQRKYCYSLTLFVNWSALKMLMQNFIKYNSKRKLQLTLVIFALFSSKFMKFHYVIFLNMTDEGALLKYLYLCSKTYKRSQKSALKNRRWPFKPLPQKMCLLWWQVDEKHVFHY